MTRRRELEENPSRFDFFALLRELERSTPRKPRIGRSVVPADDVVNLGQEPWVAFPDTNVAFYEETTGKPPVVRTRFLGFFGPQGPLPLNTTLEAMDWNRRQRDPAFIRFADVFTTRFHQLFYRAWAQSRPTAHLDRPEDNRFAAYVGSFVGLGTTPYLNRDSVEDYAKIAAVGIGANRIKSASRLRDMIRAVFGLDADVEERVGTWLEFEAADRMGLGQNGSTLGVDSFIGERVFSLGEKLTIHIKTRNLKEYKDLLPSGPLFRRLADLVYFYIGESYEFDVRLALKREAAPAMRLGSSGELGWTGWVSPGAGGSDYLNDARFAPGKADHPKRKASGAASPAPGAGGAVT